MVFVVLLQNQCKTRQILISGKYADHRNIRSDFQKPVDFICQNFHLFNKRFNEISFFCRPLQIFATPHHFLGQLRTIHQNRLPPANRNRQTITFHNSTSMKRISGSIYCRYILSICIFILSCYITFVRATSGV